MAPFHLAQAGFTQGLAQAIGVREFEPYFRHLARRAALLRGCMEAPSGGGAWVDAALLRECAGMPGKEGGAGAEAAEAEMEAVRHLRMPPSLLDPSSNRQPLERPARLFSPPCTSMSNCILNH